MTLVVGLGNPGSKYRDTRHNIGFEVADALVRRFGGTFQTAPVQVPDSLVAKRFGDVPMLVAKPLTFMNLSGDAVAALVRYHDIEINKLLVIVDEVALPFGKLRARAHGSAGGHNGLKSIIERLGTTQFARLRLGVGRGDARRGLADHVLSRFESEERPQLETFIDRAADAAEMFAAAGIGTVMNAYNSDAAAPEVD